LGGLSLGYGNALVSVPATVHISRLKSPGAADFNEVMFGSWAIAVAAGLGSVVAAGLWFTLGQPAVDWAAGAFVGSWTLRNHIRASLFARRSMILVAASDLSYATGSAALIAVLFLLQSGPHQLGPILALLAIGNMIAILVALRGRGAPIRIS